MSFTPARTGILCRIVGHPEAGDRRRADCLRVALDVRPTGRRRCGLLPAATQAPAGQGADARPAGRASRAGQLEVAQSRGRAWAGWTGDAEQELGFIDRVCLPVFGRMPHAGADRIETAFDVGDPASRGRTDTGGNTL